jgi:hypothetical protein
MTIDPTQAYRVLGLHPGATLDEVKTAFRDLAQVWHPDRFPENDRLREKAMQNQMLINEAYAVLQKYRPKPTPAAVAVAAPPPAPTAPRHFKHSFFTGVAAVRNSIDVLWPSATYARKRRRRLPPLKMIILGIIAMVLMALAATALWGMQHRSF